MAGAKGKSGGARPGSGPKKRPPVPFDGGMDMLEFLQKVALGHLEASSEQVRAAIAAVQYTHTKRSDGGKKEERQQAAEQAASKFRRQSPPKLVAKNGITV